MVPPTVKDDTLTSSAMHLAPAEEKRAEAASVVPESPTNLEINALEMEVGVMSWASRTQLQVLTYNHLLSFDLA